MPLNEADTRVLLIEPRLQAAGWRGAQVTREHYYRRDQAYTAGRIYLRGTRARRGEPRRVDYLLRYTDAFPIAALEAKDEGHTPSAGLEQAKGYAQDLGVAFAYSTNGHAIVEYDFFTRQSRDLTTFPSPDDLWQRWQLNTGASQKDARLIREARATYATDRLRNPLLHPYASHRVTGKTPYYFQEAAVLQVVRRLMRGQRRVLLAMATGTGKTFVAFQIVWKLVRSGWLNRLHEERPGRVLFLADRVVLRDQAYNNFSSFAGEEIGDPRFVVQDDRISLNRDLYFAIYQTLWGEDADGVRLFQKFPADFFDLVIIDRDAVGQAHCRQDLLPLRAGHDLEVDVAPKVVAAAQEFRRGDEAVFGAGATPGDAGTEKDALGDTLPVQLHKEAGQFVGSKGSAAEIAPLPEGAVAAVPLADGGEQRLEQGDALPAGHHGIVDAAGEIVARGWRAPSGCADLLGRLEAGRWSQQFEFRQCVHREPPLLLYEQVFEMSSELRIANGAAVARIQKPFWRLRWCVWTRSGYLEPVLISTSVVIPQRSGASPMSSNSTLTM
jgi:hypothetical protein